MSQDADDVADDAEIGGEQVEYYPAPAALIAHDEFERAFGYDFDAALDGEDYEESQRDNKEVVARCVVSARLRLSRFRTIEFLELSKTTDNIAALYPGTAWVKERGVYGAHLIVMVLLWLLVFVGGLTLALRVSSVWEFGVVLAGIAVFMELSRRVMAGHLIRESSWYKLPYSTWCDLVKCMTIWDTEGVSHSDIYTRVRVFFDDVAQADEHSNNESGDKL